MRLESICKQFGYTSVSMLWYRMNSVNLENASFHMIVNNNDAMLMVDLVLGYGEIDLFVEHPIDAIYLVLFFFFFFSIFIIVLCCSFDYLVFAVCRGVRVVQVVDLPLLNQIRQVHHLPLVK